MCVWRGAAWTNQAAAGPERINMGRLGLWEDGESGLEHRGRHIRVNVDLRGLHLHAHLIVLVAGLAASVLRVLVLGAAAVVENSDDRGARGLVHSHGQGGGASAHTREGRGEGGRRGDKRGEGNELGGHGFGYP